MGSPIETYALNVKNPGVFEIVLHLIENANGIKYSYAWLDNDPDVYINFYTAFI